MDETHGRVPRYPVSMLFSEPMPVAHVDRHVLDEPVERHCHEFFELAFVASGQGSHVSEHGAVQLRRGDVMVVTPGTWHGYARCDGLEVVNCCLPPSVVRHELGWARADPEVGGLLWPADRGAVRHGNVDDKQLASLLARLRRLRRLASAGAAGHAETVGHLTIVLARVATYLRITDSGQRRETPAAVIAGMQMLESVPGQQWRLADLAGALHVTPAHLTRLFTTHLGVPPMTYLAQYRAELAAMMLRRSDANVARIGAQVGWPDPNYFARRFRQHFGMSPSAYRARVGH